MGKNYIHTNLYIEPKFQYFGKIDFNPILKMICKHLLFLIDVHLAWHEKSNISTKIFMSIVSRAFWKKYIDTGHFN